MKQLPMTTELSALIKGAVGEDVDTENLAVFECIALNTNPLPGKGGTIFEEATVTPLTLQQMVDSIEGGNHLPLISDHQLMGEPKGRAFHASLAYDNDSGQLELRILFYLDPTEVDMVRKLNAGSLDEVSVSFLPSQLLCSECGWDYRGEDAEYSNLRDRTCANGHEVGTDGVHVQLVGLSAFIELSLVARGAADKPKIVGKSQAKLIPASSMRLAAKGFEIDGLICQAGLGEKVVMTFDPNKFMTDLVEAKTSVATLTASNASLTASLSEATAAVTAAEAQVAELTEKLEAAEAKPSNEADYQIALTFLGELLTKLSVAAGGEAPAELPKTVADLKVAIEDKTTKLTAILPVGGVSAAAGGGNDAPTLHAHVFTNRNLKN